MTTLAGQSLALTYGTIMVQHDKEDITFVFKHTVPFEDNLAKSVRIPHYRVAPFVKALRRAYDVAVEGEGKDSTTYVDNDILFEAILFTIKPESSLPTRVSIQVVWFQNKPYIWLRRFWFKRYEAAPSRDAVMPMAKPGENGEWGPYKNGFRFSHHADDFQNIDTFIKTSLATSTTSTTTTDRDGL